MPKERTKMFEGRMDQYVTQGWVFAYCPETRFVGATHPSGGKFSVCEVVHSNAYESHEETGKAIAAGIMALGSLKKIANELLELGEVSNPPETTSKNPRFLKKSTQQETMCL